MVLFPPAPTLVGFTATTYLGTWIKLVAEHAPPRKAPDSELSLKNLHTIANKGKTVTWPKTAYSDYLKLRLRYAAVRAIKDHPAPNEVPETQLSNATESTGRGDPTHPSAQNPEVTTGTPEVNEEMVDTSPSQQQIEEIA